MKNNFPAILTILGVTGDLAAKKILPALFNLFVKKELPDPFTIVGFGRREFTEETFRKYVKEMVEKRIHPSKTDALEQFVKIFTYHHGYFEQSESYPALKNKLESIEKDLGLKEHRRLYYFSILPELYATVFGKFKEAGVVSKATHSRIMIEKPFGRNLESARELDALLKEYFTENKIYRIDHYFGKKIVEEILNFRQKNNLFGSDWDNQVVKEIQISLLETVGVEHRGEFYDGVGAMRDMGQNHILAILSQLTMDKPNAHDGIHERRLQVLNDLKLLTEDEVKDQSLRAQYEGYKNIDGVSSQSQTETYFKIKFEINNDTWRGVPILAESGKRMQEQNKFATVTLKNGQQVTFELEPTEQIIESGKPPVLFESPTHEHIQYVAEYEKMLFDAIHGDRTLFVTDQEVEAMWRFTDPFVAAWQKNLVPLKFYPPDSTKGSPQG